MTSPLKQTNKTQVEKQTHSIDHTDWQFLNNETIIPKIWARLHMQWLVLG